MRSAILSPFAIEANVRQHEMRERSSYSCPRLRWTSRERSEHLNHDNHV